MKTDVAHLYLALSKAGKIYEERIEKTGDKEKKKRLKALKLHGVDLDNCFDDQSQLN